MKKLFIVVLALIMVLSFCACSTNKVVETPGLEEEKETIKNEKSKLDNYEIIIDGMSFVFPMTYEEFISKGLLIQDIYERNEDLIFENAVLDAKSELRSYRTNYTSFTTGKTNNISIIVTNPSNENKNIKHEKIKI